MDAKYHEQCAPVAQRIERWPPEPRHAQVRLLPGAPFFCSELEVSGCEAPTLAGSSAESGGRRRGGSGRLRLPYVGAAPAGPTAVGASKDQAGIPCHCQGGYHPPQSRHDLCWFALCCCQDVRSTMYAFLGRDGLAVLKADWIAGSGEE